MPLNAGQIAMINAGTQLAVGGLNYFSQYQNNRAQLAYNERMYDRQRADALSDYNMQNQYNTPEMQMQRFKDAGLNPNLIYKQGNEGATVRSTEAKSYNPTAPQFQNFDVGSIIAQSQNIESVQAATDLTKERIKTEQLSQELKRWDALMKPLDYASKDTKNYVASELADTQIQAGKEGLNKILADIKASTDKNTRENQLQSGKLTTQQMVIDNIAQNIAYTAVKKDLTTQQIENLRAVLEKIKTDTDIQKLELDLRQKGLSFHDPYYIRILGKAILDKFKEGVTKDAGKDILAPKEIEHLLENPKTWSIQPKY